ncbi:hypothetical protein OVY01_08325 [Robbsia sp. Bb-Pol-6]|uniref:Uncharacterized protein n=1 Tax=Robbsia betulipollinis TaxID=2981849 RepID=A0ABT3ZL24_9BURK|nr:hypothetical protein [Robbsia betulipollinis]MCY0387238.1 hypothetical protein [Robbsia betulipollinis]
MMSTISAKDNGLGELKILSRSDVTQYIQVSVMRVTHPGTDHEKNVPVSPVDEPTLVASPQRLILEPRQVHVVRLIVEGSPNKETLYRVAIKPVAAPTAGVDHPASGISTSVGLSIVWAPLVTVAPAVSAPAWSIDRVHGVLANDGNVHLGVDKVAYCASETDANSCRWQSVKHIVYVGEKLGLDARPDRPGDTFRIEYKTPDGQVRNEARGPSPQPVRDMRAVKHDN